MGSGGLAVDAMAIGCLGVERRVERFFSYLAISVFSISGLLWMSLFGETFHARHGPDIAQEAIVF
jgi:hypothetical protein